MVSQQNLTSLRTALRDLKERLQGVEALVDSLTGEEDDDAISATAVDEPPPASAMEAILWAADKVASAAISREEQAWIDSIERVRASLSQSEDPVIEMRHREGVPVGSDVVRCVEKSVTPYWCRFLMKLVQALKPSNCLELGTGTGISTAYIGAGLQINGHGQLVSVEGSEDLARIARRTLRTAGIADFQVRNTSFANFLGRTMLEGEPIDFVFIDGQQNGPALTRNVEKLLPVLAPGAIVILDDVCAAPGIRRAWQKLVEHEDVGFSLDFGRFGVCQITRTGERSGHRTVQTISHARPPAGGGGVECPLCGGEFAEFLPYGPEPRPDILCPGCRSQGRQRLLWLYLRNETNLFSEPLRVMHVAPEQQLQDLFRGLPNLDYISADLNRANASVWTDITRMAFKDDSFDAILCYHVLEHIPDDAAAMRELCRVLKPDGWSILQVPLDLALAETYEDPSITSPQERERHFGQLDHVRRYGRDYADRLRAAGLEVLVDEYARELTEFDVKRYGLKRNEDIYLCRKSALPASPA